MLLLFPLSEWKRCELSLRWNANGQCFLLGTIMTKSGALIYCRLVTLVLNWSKMLHTSSAERLHISSTKKPLHNWDSGSCLHDLKPLPSFRATGCQIHTNEWTDTLHFTLHDETFLPHTCSLLQRLILDVCCLAPLRLSLFLFCPGYYCLFYSQRETKHWATIASHNRKKIYPPRLGFFPLMEAQMKKNVLLS